jgi:predicted CXXCH cytochrome family protein
MLITWYRRNRNSSIKLCLRYNAAKNKKGEYQMKKISAVVAMFAVTAFAGVSFAAGPESIDLPASMGKVTFPHKKHQELVKQDCKKCHAKAPGKIAELGKDWAHKTCKGCHTEMKKGPVGCKDCHKK